MWMTLTEIKKVIEFNVQLTANHYTNFQNVHLCFPIKIHSATDNHNDNNKQFFLIKEMISKDMETTYRFCH